MRTKERTDRAIMGMLLDPLRMNRIARATATTSADTPLRVRLVVEEAARSLRATYASFTLLASDLVIATTNSDDLPLTLDAKVTFCRYVTHEPFRVNNSAKNTLVCDLGAALGVGSYLGVPVTFAGYVLGALCVWEPHPRHWTVADEAILTRLAEELTQWWKT